MNQSEYVEFCQEYQRQIAIILRTYNTMSTNLAQMVRSNEQQTNANASTTNMPNTNTPTTNVVSNQNINANGERNNNTLRTRNTTARTPQPRVNIYEPIVTIPSSRVSPIRRPNNVTTHLFNTTIDATNINDINALFNTNLNDLFGNIFSDAFNITPNNLEPVSVAPTQDEINRATETIRFGDIVNPSQNTCPIGLTTFSENDEIMRIRQCGHFFEPSNLLSWLENNVRCPLCRYDIREYSGPDTSDNSDTLTETNPINSETNDETNIENNNSDITLESTLNDVLHETLDISNNTTINS